MCPSVRPQKGECTFQGYPLPAARLRVTLLSCSNIGISFGATELLKDVTFTVAEGERWGIIGRNGAGKSSIDAPHRCSMSCASSPRHSTRFRFPGSPHSPVERLAILATTR